MQCPQCHHQNPKGAIECADCGVVFANQQRPKKGQPQSAPRARCAHANCEQPSICRMKTATGWANLCEHHCELLIQTRADQTCQRLGFTTVKQKQEWVRTYMKTVIAKMQPTMPRESGEE